MCIVFADTKNYNFCNFIILSQARMQKFELDRITELQRRTFAFKGKKYFNLFKISMLFEILLGILLM